MGLIARRITRMALSRLVAVMLMQTAVGRPLCIIITALVTVLVLVDALTEQTAR